MKTLHYDWRWHFDVEPEALWPLVSDTNHFNHDAGVPHIERLGEGANQRQQMRLRRLGVAIDYEEDPFEWVRPSRFSVVRRYRTGPVAELRVLIELSASNGGTAVRYQVWATPRGALGYPAIAFQIGWLSERSFHRVFQGFAEDAKQRPVLAAGGIAMQIKLGEPAELPSDAGARINSIRARLASVRFAAGLIDALIELVRRGDELSLARIKPHVLADAGG